jgi:hypothetical protein
MADNDQPQQPTHRAYSVIKREGQDDFWLNLGLAFPHKDGTRALLQGSYDQVDQQLHGGTLLSLVSSTGQ